MGLPTVRLPFSPGMRSGNGAPDFDFLLGRWRVHNRRLRACLKGSVEWDEFDTVLVVRPISNGLGNEDKCSFRLFNPATRLWSIYRTDSRRGFVSPPLVGSFTGDTGVFEGTDAFEGRSIRVRSIWSRVRTASPRLEQACSEDGSTWETNWVTDFTRLRDVEIRVIA